MMKQEMITMPKYEAYKDSGVEWLGEIPSEWEVKSVKAIFQERKENNDPIKTKDILSLCMYRGVIPYAEKGASGNKAKEDITAYRLAYPGDIVMNSMNVVAGSVGLSKYFGAVSPVYYMLRPRKKEDHVEYFSAIFRNEAFQKSLVGLGNGILVKQSESTGKLNTIRMRIPMSKMNMVEMPYPSPEEQTAIANFLDQKTTQIDQAIAIKEKQIELLQERKQILIQNAVTRGLDPAVKMKDSGLKWIGEIPENWEVSIAKHALRKLDRPRKKNGNTVICSNHGCSKLLGEVNQGLVSLTQHDYQGVNEGDLLVHGMDTWHGAIAISEHTGDCTSVVHVCDSDHNKTYIAYYLKMLAIMNVYKVISNGVRGNTSDFRSWSKFGEVQLILPPKHEQEMIVELLNEQAQKTDHAINLAQQQVARLKEYKTTLINSAVTGKIKVV